MRKAEYSAHTIAEVGDDMTQHCPCKSHHMLRDARSTEKQRKGKLGKSESAAIC